MIFLLLTAFREPSYCKISSHIVNSYVKEFAKPRGLTLTGYGGAMMNDIQGITLRFVSFDALNIDQARILYVDIMEEFLNSINCHEKIRPHLHNFPFEESNIKLSISFKEPDTTIRGDRHVALMGIARDHILYFSAYDPITEKFYNISKIDVNDPVGTVTVKTHDQDYIQVDQTITYSTEEQLNKIDIGTTSENGTLTIKVTYPELNIDEVIVSVTENIYMGTHTRVYDTNPCPEVSHTIWLPQGQKIEQKIIDINTFTGNLRPE